VLSCHCNNWNKGTVDVVVVYDMGENRDVPGLVLLLSNMMKKVCILRCGWV
jgi:hypothetical protein